MVAIETRPKSINGVAFGVSLAYCLLRVLGVLSFAYPCRVFFCVFLTGGSQVVGSGPAIVRPRFDFPRHQRAFIAFGLDYHCLQ